MFSKSKYNHLQISEGLYEYWKKNKIFEYDKNSLKQPFSIILPPPNVTGHLHLGHAWDSSLQDTIIRYKKLRQFNTLWIPGTDHAGIATQSKFEKILSEQNINYKSWSREQFLDELQKWVNEQKHYIHHQWERLGLGLAYENEVFTLDEHVQKLTTQVFVDLYQKGLIYQAYKLVNWDIKLKTAISDIETIYKPNKTKMYYFKYFLENKKDYLVVATTRPETMFVDTNLFVNPNDQRFSHLINKKAINPVNDQALTILADEYIDMEFGTGVMKCTPAHDFHDYELAKKHQITNYQSTMNLDGTLNDHAQSVLKNYQGIDRLLARDLLVNELKERDLLVKIEDIENTIAFSERTNEIVEPLLSKQWFVKMQPIVDHLRTIQKTKANQPEFLPARFASEINNWFDNIQDWCISRQLVWGHRLPVYYHKKTNKILVVNEKPKDFENYIQDNDVLDTWFSSGLWPIATTIKNKELAKFFPISVLVTAYDILFFWVARMLFQCTQINNVNPLKTIIFHGLIRDEKNRKMSKSLGNGIDPNDVIDQYGLDSLRMFLTSTSTLGEDLRFSYEKIEWYNLFFNKIWNAKNFIIQQTKPTKIYDWKLINHPINIWFINQLNDAIERITKNMDDYNFVVANKNLTDFIWNVFCNQYLEYIKPLFNLEQHRDETTFVLYEVFKHILIMIHPHAIYLTERIYLDLYHDEISILKEKWPEVIKVKSNDEETCLFTEIFSAIKDLRIKNNIAYHNIIEINLITSKNLSIVKMNQLLSMYNIKCLNINQKQIEKEWNLITCPNVTIEYENKYFDLEEMIKKAESKKIMLEKEIARSNQILSNQNFLNKAKKEKVEEEKNKLANYNKQYEEINLFLKNLREK